MNPQPALRFFLGSEPERIAPLGAGNINDTFLVVRSSGEPVVLQRINQTVFPDPGLVQENIRRVTAHLREARPSDEEEDLRFPLLLTGAAGPTFADESGVWRLLSFIPGEAREAIDSPAQAGALGSCLGLFHRLLAGLDCGELADPLPGFHHTPTRLDRFDRVLEQSEPPPDDPDVRHCLAFIEECRSLAPLLHETPGLTRCVIHGDPKVANFLFDPPGSDRVTGLVDLDTVGPGLLLHDLGDALRSCCNRTGECPDRPETTHFDAALFSAWLKGYASRAEMMLTAADKAHIVDAVRVIAFELGLRFFTDHLEGDRYFKVQAPGDNLRRALVQFRLVRSIEQQQTELEKRAAALLHGRA
ncbi:MAG: phosphotransferase [Desulfobulbaceae bacterium]